MTRRADLEQIHLGRRDTIRNVIIQSRGLDPEVAERWCDAWEAEAALQGIERGRDSWQVGKLWIDQQCAARKRPPN